MSKENRDRSSHRDTQSGRFSKTGGFTKRGGESYQVTKNPPPKAPPAAIKPKPSK